MRIEHLEGEAQEGCFIVPTGSGEVINSPTLSNDAFSFSSLDDGRIVLHTIRLYFLSFFSFSNKKIRLKNTPQTKEKHELHVARTSFRLSGVIPTTYVCV